MSPSKPSTTFITQTSVTNLSLRVSLNILVSVQYHHRITRCISVHVSIFTNSIDKINEDVHVYRKSHVKSRDQLGLINAADSAATQSSSRSSLEEVMSIATVLRVSVGRLIHLNRVSLLNISIKVHVCKLKLITLIRAHYVVISSVFTVQVGLYVEIFVS